MNNNDKDTIEHATVSARPNKCSKSGARPPPHS